MLRLTPVLLALCLAGCFAEPPSTSSSGDEASSSGTSPGSTSEDGTSTTDEADGSSTTTGGFGTASFGTSSSTGFITGTETGDGEPEPAVLLALYEDCARGVWETFETDLFLVSCENSPAEPHTIGGGWRFETFNSPAFGMVEDALVIRPGPFDGGVTQFTINSGKGGFEMDGTRLRGRYEFVNTEPGAVDSGTMTFQILRLPPDGAPGGGETLLEHISLSEASGELDIELDIAGPMDDLVFFVSADSSELNQGVALYGPVIVAGP